MDFFLENLIAKNTTFGLGESEDGNDYQ